MARPIWQGQLQISLVSCAVSLVPASSSARPVAFHEVDRKTGERLHHRKVTESGAPREDADIARGYEYERGQYLVIDPADLKKLRLPGQKNLAIEHFVDRGAIDPAFYERPYFLVPKDDAQARIMATISQALRDSGRAGLAEITFSGREHFVAIAPPVDDASPWLNLYLLRYSTELRDPEDSYRGLRKPALDKNQLAMARQLIDSYSDSFDPAAFHDDFETALREFVDARLHHRALPRGEARPKPGKVIDLMDALKRSLAERQSGAPTTRPRPRSRRRKAA